MGGAGGGGEEKAVWRWRAQLASAAVEGSTGGGRRRGSKGLGRQRRKKKVSAIGSPLVTANDE